MSELSSNDVIREIEEQTEPFTTDGYEVTEIALPPDHLNALLSTVNVSYANRVGQTRDDSSLLGYRYVVDSSISGVVVTDFEDTEGDKNDF